MKIIYIYGLYDVNDLVIRYVGKTNNLNNRLKQHIKNYQKGKNVYKNNWIKSVYNKGSRIDIKILEESTEENWDERERYWISNIDNLTNLTEGGDCGTPIKFTITYEECKSLIKNLQIKSSHIWENSYHKLPLEVPKNPREVYLKRGWISWGDFLETGRKQDNLIILDYISYDESKKWIKDNLQQCNSSIQWRKLAKEGKIPNNIPNRPDRFYKKNRGWVSWGDFLGTGRISNNKKQYLSYEELKKIIKNLGITSTNEWKQYWKDNKKYENIPMEHRTTNKDHRTTNKK